MTIQPRCHIFVALLLAAQVSWAGPIEEVNAIGVERAKAFEQGNLDAFTEAYADDAMLTSSFQAHRVDGKGAIKVFFADMFQNYPKRKFRGRQPVARAYGDNMVIQNSYAVLQLTNDQGHTDVRPLRSTTVWVRQGGRWQVVEQHNSRLPEAN